METTQGHESVAIIIVNWNGYFETSNCLDSLESLAYSDYRVVVVDNGSTDSSGTRLAAEFDWCSFVFNDENRGFGGGCNSGIEYALALGVDHVVLLNPDARIETDALTELVDVARESGANVVGATIRTDGDSLINSTPAYFPDIFFYSGYRRNLPLSVDSPDEYERRRWFETDRIEGAGVLLSAELLHKRRETVGHYLDDSLFMYGEEVELAMWCREHGERCVVATEAIVDHDSAASSSRQFQLYYLTRNRLLIANRYFRFEQRVGYSLLYPLTRAIIATRLVQNGHFGVARSIVCGLIDGYGGVTGKRW